VDHRCLAARTAPRRAGEEVADGRCSFDGTPRVEIATLRAPAELTERQGWVHHVVDVDTAEMITPPLDRPLAPLSRAQRLSRGSRLARML
jgi:hypothetical protein